MTDIAPRSPAGPGPLGALKPLDPELSPEVQAWAQEVRTLWSAVGMSVNRFARLNHIDKGTVSRYLNGRRVPGDRWFLDRLLAIQAEKGKQVSPQVREHLTGLQLEALQAAHPHEYRVRLVRDELDAAVVGQREAERYAAHLEHQLADRIRQLDEFAGRHGRLKAAWDADRAAMQEDRDHLTAEIADLAHQLDHARQRATDTEQRCQELEQLLDQLEEPSPPGPADPLPDVDFTSPVSVATLLTALWEVGAAKQARALADRAVTGCPVTHPAGVATLLKAMWQVGAADQARALADRAVTGSPVNDFDAVTTLLSAMWEIGAEEQTRALGNRSRQQQKAVTKPEIPQAPPPPRHTHSDPDATSPDLQMTSLFSF
ncbi:hypothetical protein ACQPZP_18010 [Spirillospora sp. CA-142024]|uniref:helix-turn-helix domain-containing protein n=1 Tax=Spirillospora sp. CA-142024 TaxID=3240036 RepID=UPI003D8FA3B3